MRPLIAPLSLTLGLAVALFAAPVFVASSVQAEEKKEEHQHAAGAKLGEVTLGGTVFTVELEGKVEPGKEVEIKLTPKGALPAGKIRGWIGIESGKGSMKGHSHKEDDGLCVHAEAPETIAADAKVWLELDVDGTKTKVGLGLPK